MLAFVLTLAFTPRFKDLTTGDLHLYLATLILGSMAASMLMAPAALNRLVFRHRLRRRMVSAANRFALYGLALLLATLGCAIMLILHVISGSSGFAAAITVAVVAWFVLLWFAVPAWWRYRHRECGSGHLRTESESHPSGLEPHIAEMVAERPAIDIKAIPDVIGGELHRRPPGLAEKSIEMDWRTELQSSQPHAHWKIHRVGRNISRLNRAKVDSVSSDDETH
jgi:hypothetical protein